MNTRPGASNNTQVVAWLVVLGALLSGCGNSSTGGPGCTSSTECATAGTECNVDTGRCEKVCEQTGCSAGQECSSHFGVCTPVQCGKTVACENPGDFCDFDAHVCYPTSGKCFSSTDCPRFDGRVSKANTLLCSSGFCQLKSEPQPIVPAYPPVPGPAAVRILSPSIGAQVDTAEQLQLRWEPTAETTTIALILTTVPKGLAQVLDSAVWGHVLPAAAEPVARWQDGVAIQKGVWMSSSATVPGGPLYFVVQSVRAGKLVGISDPIPFRIGSAWPALYDRCSDLNLLPGSCAHPTRSQICWEGYCRLLCASHLDCKAASSTLCAAPIGGVRICG